MQLLDDFLITIGHGLPAVMFKPLAKIAHVILLNSRGIQHELGFYELTKLCFPLAVRPYCGHTQFFPHASLFELATFIGRMPDVARIPQ